MISTIQTLAKSIIGSLHWSLTWINVFEILAIFLILSIFYKQFIKNTQAESLVKGLFILVFLWISSEVLILIDLKILGVFLRLLLGLISLSLIVVFQPELRRFLGCLGQPGFLKRIFFSTESYMDIKREEIDIIKEIIEAVKYLTKTKTGALVVFSKSSTPVVYSDVGTVIDAKISAELILTIFHPNTPLHDGAMIIEDGKIHSAGVLLPLTEDPRLSWKYGTRHRAALGMSEVSDAACLVVSEETGDVSICIDGILKKYEDITTLKSDLESILGFKTDEDNQIKHKNIFNILRKKDC